MRRRISFVTLHLRRILTLNMLRVKRLSVRQCSEIMA